MKKFKTPSWLKNVKNNLKTYLDKMEKEFNIDVECPKCGYNIIDDQLPEHNNPFLKHLNLYAEKAHKNAVDKGFYDCEYCKGTGKNPFNVMGSGNGDCGSCNGTGKEQNFSFPKMIALIHGEASEALEADRKGKSAVSELYLRGLSQTGKDFDVELFEQFMKNTVEDELADILLRVFDTAGYLGIDIDWHVNEKMKYNATRGKKHGKRY